MAAVLSSDMDNTDKVVNFLAESRALGLSVLPPNVNASGYMFEALAPDPSAIKPARAIRYGLGAVKGVGRGAVDGLVEARERGGAFRDLADFCARVDAQKLNKRALEALILSGAMDALAKNRASLMAQLPAAMRAAEQHARDAQAGQNDMFGAASPAAPRLELPEVEAWPIEQSLSGERETLGHYLSGHPTDAWRDLIARVATCPIGEIDKHYKPPPPERQFRYADQQTFILVGAVMGIRKQGDSRVFVQVEDFSGKFEAILYREAWIEFGPLLTRDAILVFEGPVQADDFSGGFRMRTQHIASINSVCERQTRVLRLRLNGIDADFAQRLQGVLAAYRGGTTLVRLSVRNAQARGEVELGPEWRVRASRELRQTLEKLSGVLGAELIFGPPAT
jgi:DNA polymerase-3 subunit alpha